MTPWLLMIVVAVFTFFFADSILTPILLLLWKKIWFLTLKIQALMTKKNVLQALVQSLVLTVKAALRAINKAVTVWLLPLLMTRRQRYWLHHRIDHLRRWMRMRVLRAWVRWRRQPFWIRVGTLLPAIIVTVFLFVASGFLLAALFGVSFVVPWIGGLPVATILFLRRQIALLALYVFERMGLGPVVNKVVDRVIDIVWWRTPEPVQRRFDAWWRWFKMRLSRWVIGPRRKVVKRMARLHLRRARTPSPMPEIDQPGERTPASDPGSGDPRTPPI